MAIQFLDANIIIRHLTKDNEALSKKAHQILKRIETGAVSVTTCESIISECVYVLSSPKLYNFTRDQIKTALGVIVSFKGLKLPHKRVYQKALELYAASQLDFSDALAIAHMQRQQITDIYSFDTDFDRVASVKRREQ